MLFKLHKQTDIIKNYGIVSQLGVATEELAELIQAINKMNRLAGNTEGYRKGREHLAEEIADVIVCIDQLKTIYHITDAEITEIANYKILRQLERMRRGEK